MVIGLNKDPADALSESQLEVLKHLDGKTINIGTPGIDCDVVDVDGTYRQWMSSIDAKYFILRPDFYVAATASTESEISNCFDDVVRKLDVPMS